MDNCMPPEVREYFAKGRRKIKKIIPNEGFTLTIIFDNNEKRVYNMQETLKLDVFSPFRDFENFKRVYVDSHGCVAWDIDPNIDSNVVWNNKVDLCPDSCYIYSLPVRDIKEVDI